MKKILAIALAIVMMMAIAVPAFAADLNVKPEDSGEVLIVTSDKLEDGITDADWYVVSIPADTTIAWGVESTALPYSAQTHLKYGQTLEVKVTSADYLMTYEPEEGVKLDIAFALSGDTAAVFDTVTKDAETNNAAAIAKSVSVDITKQEWDNAVVGAYSDILTFSAEIV